MTDLPASGGSFTRSENGALEQTEAPTQPAGAEPAPKPAPSRKKGN